MIHQIFSVYDQKALAYLPTFILPEVDMAKRIFGDCINDEGHQFGKHPEDYTLFVLGTFNDRTGELETNPTPMGLGNGVQYVVQSVKSKPKQKALTNGKEIPRSDVSPIQPGTKG